MTPLILRPEPQASNFAQLLRSAGHQPVVTPLLTIIAGRELASLPQWLLWADIVVAVSAAAVEQGNAYLTKAGIGWPDKPFWRLATPPQPVGRKLESVPTIRKMHVAKGY